LQSTLEQAQIFREVYFPFFTASRRALSPKTFRRLLSSRAAGTISMMSTARKPSAEHRFRKIESRQNTRVKELRAGLRRGMLADQRQIAIEGDHLLREAIRSGLHVRTVLVRSGNESLLDLTLIGDAEVLLLSPDVFSSVTTTEHPQGIAAFVDMPRFEPPDRSPAGARSSAFDQMMRGTPLIVIAAGLQDPGNLGTLARSAEAFGATGMILLPGTVSLWNPKAMRASSGSAFRLPTAHMDAEEAFGALRAKGVRLLAAVPRGGAAADLSLPTALLLGNEGAGLAEAWIAQADARVTIDCPGDAESLNAAVAGSVLLYEAARQRRESTARVL
jgi:RNA methyltransferase, TrmH family